MFARKTTEKKLERVVIVVVAQLGDDMASSRSRVGLHDVEVWTGSIDAQQVAVLQGW